MKVLITGATGFLGSHLVRALVENGHSVRALVRPTSNYAKIQADNLEIINGDLLDRDSLRAAVTGQDIVFNNAGKVVEWGKREDFYRINVDGTRNLLEISLLAGVKRFVHTSSLTVLGKPRNSAPVNETAPYTEAFFEPYTETKIIAEKLVLDYYRKNLAVTIIRPGIIWGPGDTTIFPRMERLARKGLVFTIGKGTNILCLSYVANVVAGIMRAADSAQAVGQIYHITDEEKIVSKTFFAALTDIIGIKAPLRSIPFAVLYAIASGFEMWAKMRKQQELPLLTRYGLYLMGSHYNIDISKAKQELGYRAGISFREGMQKVAAWYGRRDQREQD